MKARPSRVQPTITPIFHPNRFIMVVSPAPACRAGRFPRPAEEVSHKRACQAMIRSITCHRSAASGEVDVGRYPRHQVDSADFSWTTRAPAPRWPS